MPKLPSSLDNVRLAFGRLSQREQLMVLAIAGGLVLLLLVVLGLSVSSAITSAERRVKVKTEQLIQVLQKEGEYRARIAKKKEQVGKILNGSNVRLVSMIEDFARQSQVEIGRLKPEEGKPTPEGIVESRVDLRASNLSVDRFQDFLSRIENAPRLMVVKRLKVTKPYRRDTLNIELTVITYKKKES